MLSLVFAYGWTICFIGLAIAAFLTLTAPFRAPVVGLLLMIVVADVGYTAGLSKGMREAHQASIAYQAKIDQRDLTIRNTMDALGQSLTAAQEVQTASDSKAADYEAQLSATRACPLSDGDRQRLLDIR